MMNKNAPHNIKNIYGNATVPNKNSIAGAATNLPKPNPVIASPLAKPLWSSKLLNNCLIGQTYPIPVPAPINEHAT